MRKILSILLLMALGLPSLTPLLAMRSSDEASLPACCRRNGKHHCMMSMTERARLSNHTPTFSAPPEKCPYCPSAIPNIHPSGSFVLPIGRMIYAGLFSHAAIVVQVECRRRIARDRAHGKRGPPVFLL